MSEQQNIEVLQRAYEAFGRGDIETVLAQFDDTIEWFSPGPADLPISGTRRGRQQVADFFRVLDELFEYERFEPKKFIAQGDDVVVLGEETFRIRATGTRIELEWAQVCEMKNGKVMRFHEYVDVSAVVEELRGAKAQLTRG
jgi:ketosteroid isomerase-like protein